ncbi:murein L,D-transpeptidase family protein [uncultured Shimia sp.]|uniref:L,D-transpeptidase family protein n=1 Tax=uncultured Shimia sp. TaxID=573152 RepID=UPI0025CD2391|nr:murein L,D-transpeptidase family protein [uncultured Shimia sp.]
MRKFLKALFFLLCIASALGIFALYRPHYIPPPIKEAIWPRDDIAVVRARQTPVLSAGFAKHNSTLGAPVYIRIFKEERELELWVQTPADTYALFKTYPICNHSGGLGPKLKEGDRQSPEGFYTVSKSALNPNSSYHLSFNLGFPNRFDRTHDRSGSFLMVHGDCVSVGCYAMTDPAIEEIYVAVEAALKGGQSAVPVHAFPFRPTPQRMAMASGHQWESFWQQLAPAYHAFAETNRPPLITVDGGKYLVTAW